TTSTRHRSANGRIRSKLVTLTAISTRSRVLRRAALGVRTSIGAKRSCHQHSPTFYPLCQIHSERDGDQGNRRNPSCCYYLGAARLFGDFDRRGHPFGDIRASNV